jgi:hypothetical protein
VGRAKEILCCPHVWKKRFNEVPSGRNGSTWAQWFEKMFGENLEAYAKRMAKEKPG